MTPLLLPVIAAALAAGIALGTRAGPPPAALVGASLGLLLAAGLAARRRAILYLLGTGLAAAACGAALCGAALRPIRPPCHVAHRADGRTWWRLAARVMRDPVTTHRDVRVLLRADALLAPRRAGLCGRVELHLSGRTPLVRGDRVVLRSRLRPALGSRNPGTSVSRLRYLSDDTGAIAHANGDDVVVLQRAGPSMVRGVRDRVRRLLGRAASGASRQILAALVLGDRASIDPALRRDFARAGVSHLLAVSGLHLALLAGGVLWLSRRLLLLVPWLARRTDVRRVAAPIAALAALAYTQISGAAPSTTRACIMAVACFSGLCLGRAPDLARPLCLAAVVLLVRDPLDLLRPGFQLSFLAVIGIGMIVLRPSPGRGLLRAVRRLALVTAVATAVTAPVVAYHFHEVSVVGLIVNLLAIPATTFVLLPLALTGAGVGLLWPGAGEALLGLAGWWAGQLHGLCAAVAALDGVVLQWSPGPLLAAAAATLVVAILAGRRRGRTVLLLASAALLCCWGGGQLSRRLAPRLEVTFLDVGQGDSAFVQTPGGATMLVDGGGSHSGQWDPGQSRVVPFLRSRGVRHLDLVVASHPHPDHVAGLRAVVEAVPVHELWVCWHDEPSPWLAPLCEAARRRGVRVVAPRVRSLGQAVLRPLWPRGRPRCADPAYSTNDNSIVLRLQWRRSVVLFAGDIEREAERELLRGPPARLRAQLLKVPHHGSSTSTSAGFLRAVSPRVAVISCGAGNGFGFPHRAVLERLRSAGVSVLRTDRLGAVVVELEPGGGLSWSAPVL